MFQPGISPPTVSRLAQAGAGCLPVERTGLGSHTHTIALTEAFERNRDSSAVDAAGCSVSLGEPTRRTISLRTGTRRKLRIYA